MYLYRSGNSDNYKELPEFNCHHFTLSGWIHSQLSCVAKIYEMAFMHTRIGWNREIKAWIRHRINTV